MLRKGPAPSREHISTMPEQSIDYGRLVERALRQVVRAALDVVANQGLPGRHHLYITFRTDHPGVALTDDLLARYPSEMTIVLQHEFWGLEVAEDRFAVGLSFGGVPHRLEIPFEAVTVFADPSVEFGLQFTAARAVPPAGGPPQPRLAEPPNGPGQASAERPNEPGQAPAEVGSAEVVALDRFRKK
jgi:hypothetical protein